MKMPFFASFIVFLIWLAFTLRRGRQRTADLKQSFWQKELAANSTRRKPLDDLNYITIPFDTLPVHVMPEDPRIQEYLQTLHQLAESPIVNFTGISNTDLKLQYGAPNIDLLSRYDQSYTTMVCTLQKWAVLLHEEGYTEEACRILEFSVSTDSDITAAYRLLASVYRSKGQADKLQALKERAEQLKSGSRAMIVRALQEYDL